MIETRKNTDKDVKRGQTANRVWGHHIMLRVGEGTQEVELNVKPSSAYVTHVSVEALFLEQKQGNDLSSWRSKRGQAEKGLMIQGFLGGGLNEERKASQED